MKFTKLADGIRIDFFDPDNGLPDWITFTEAEARIVCDEFIMMLNEY